MEDSKEEVKRIYSNCGSNTTYIRPKTGWTLWLRDNKGGWHCCKCHNKLVTNPKWHKKWNTFYNNKRLRFKGKLLLLKENPRKGVCSWCNFQGYTQTHHIQYHENEPLKDTIELCASCHRKESWRLGSHKLYRNKHGRFISRF